MPKTKDEINAIQRANYAKRKAEGRVKKQVVTPEQRERYLATKRISTKKVRDAWTPEDYAKKNANLNKWRAKNSEHVRNQGRDYYEANKEKRVESTRKWQAANKPALKAGKKNYISSLPGIFSGAKQRAKRRDITFDLTYGEFASAVEASGMRCTLSGVELTLASGKNNKLSIDRKDSTKGYSSDNIQIVTAEVNWAKNDSTQSDFITMCINIAKHQCPSITF